MPVIVYSALRLLLLGVAIAALALAGMGGWLLVVVGAFVAWGLSYVLLSGPRDRAALWMAARAERRRVSGERFSAAVEADAVAEDEEARALELRTTEQEPRVAPDAPAASEAVVPSGPSGPSGPSEGEAHAEQRGVGQPER